MIRICTLIIVVFLSTPFLSSSQNMEAFFDYSTFYSPTDGSFLETHLMISGRSVNYVKQENGKYQAAIFIALKVNTKDSVYAYKEFIINSPLANDSTSGASFIDQQRLLLPDGTYELEISILDINTEMDTIKNIIGVNLDFSRSKICISDIQFIESFEKATRSSIYTKGGYTMLPYPSDIFPSELSTMTIYAEIYNSIVKIEQGQKYLIKYIIEPYGNRRNYSGLSGFIKAEAEEVNVLFKSIDISNIPSGQYRLSIEIRDNKNILLGTKETFFDRINPEKDVSEDYLKKMMIENTFASVITNLDSLKDHINSLLPISTNRERSYAENKLESGSLEELQQYFYYYWTKRNAMDPAKAWRKYHIEVMKVDRSFGTRLKKGYMTDRGRVYLQYGPPNVRMKKPYERGSLPYEIWHYYKTKRQSGVKFVFCNFSYALDDHEIVHSNASGEMIDYNWPRRILDKTKNASFDVTLERRIEGEKDVDLSDESVIRRLRNEYESPM